MTGRLPDKLIKKSPAVKTAGGFCLLFFQLAVCGAALDGKAKIGYTGNRSVAVIAGTG